MQITKASDAVGAIVEDIDVKSLSDGQFAEVRNAFQKHGALFFKNQNLTPEDHIAFAERWGNIDFNRFFKQREGYPAIAEVLKEPDQQLNIGGGWHTDHSYDEIPAMGSILYALEIPPSGGDTLFAGMAAAYEALDDDMKERIKDLKARHGNAHIFGEESEYRKAVGDRYTNADQAGQTAVHPIVLTHPESGAKGLYVNPGFTLEIVDMEPEESKALLQELYAHIMQDRFHHRHKWSEGDLAMWDNRATWHYALNDYQGHRRYLNRITIEGVALG
ncbi:TauD/TfdA dioxygenase family protein [Parasphingorhabdus halotolerans]|uniref:TauD/TfdA family dioxygenase n=1 Tax=Parasphingorhabdus halotolerans TaxID=2725558 RepID=A0A6H2DPB1_9SPHN|nr:TauD/TfdA family dioxygenase [Parasphingorhabdus halotolerans]QJB69977.1 TauD/TfdA family dioxygenase [Parasphingorhabdus halotolerans]